MPFTVLAFLTVPCTYLLARRLFTSLQIARLSALFLALSVPFLLHARQARWCAVAYVLVIVLLFCLLGVVHGRRWSTLGFAVSGILFIYTNYLVAIGVLAALVPAVAVLKPSRAALFRLTGAYLAIGLLFLPQAWFFHLLDRTGQLTSGPVPQQFRLAGAMYLTFLVPLPVLLLLGCILCFTSSNQFLPLPCWKRHTIFLLVFSLGYVAYLSLAPWFMFRYLTVLIPTAAILLALTTSWALAVYRPLGVAVLLTLLLTDLFHQTPLALLGAPGTQPRDRVVLAGSFSSPVAGFLYELISSLDTPESYWPATCRQMPGPRTSC